MTAKLIPQGQILHSDTLEQAWKGTIPATLIL
jgi:hypothetical protein